jgi:tRNA(adenine34) deaminase
MHTGATDEQFMRLALHQAQRSLDEGHLPVGAVIVHHGTVIATGHNQIDRKQTDLAHAELEAMLPVQDFLFAHAHDCDIYTTLEPCMMCFGAIVNFHFRRLIIGAPDRLVGALALIPHSPYYRRRAPAITTNVLADESRAVVARYVEQTGFRPHLLDSMQ